MEWSHEYCNAPPLGRQDNYLGVRRVKMFRGINVSFQGDFQKDTVILTAATRRLRRSRGSASFFDFARIASLE
jgi:hypothetical protein